MFNAACGQVLYAVRYYCEGTTISDGCRAEGGEGGAHRAIPCSPLAPLAPAVQYGAGGDVLLFVANVAEGASLRGGEFEREGVETFAYMDGTYHPRSQGAPRKNVVRAAVRIHFPRYESYCRRHRHRHRQNRCQPRQYRGAVPAFSRICTYYI